MTLIETQSKEGNMGKRMMYVYKVIGNGELHITWWTTKCWIPMVLMWIHSPETKPKSRNPSFLKTRKIRKLECLKCLMKKRKRGNEKMKFPNIWTLLSFHGTYQGGSGSHLLMRTFGSGSQDPFSTTNFKTVQNFEKIKIQLVFNWATHKFLNRRFSKTVLTTLSSKINLLFF